MVSRQEAQWRHSEYYACLAAQADTLRTQAEEQMVVDTTLPHNNVAELEADMQAANALKLFSDNMLQINQGWYWAHEHLRSSHFDRLASSYGVSLSGVGSLFYQAPQLIEWLKDAVAVSLKHGWHHDACTLLFRMGQIAATIPDLEIACQFQEHALLLSQEQGDRYQEQASLIELTIMYQDRGDHKQALRISKMLRHISITLEDQLGVAHAFEIMGNAYFGQGRYQRAAACYRRQLRIIQTLGHLREEGFVEASLARAFNELGRPQDAINCYERSIAILGAIDDKPSICEMSWQLGLIYVKQGDLARGMTLMEEYVELMHQRGFTELNERYTYFSQLQRCLP